MKHKGIYSDRLKPKRDNLREVAFAEQWDFENKFNLLNRLMGREVSKEEHILAATLMQWLGSSVGMGFILDASKRDPGIIRYLCGGWE